MNDYMPKPVDRCQLQDKLFALLGKVDGPAERADVTSGRSGPLISQEELDGLFGQNGPDTRELSRDRSGATDQPSPNLALL